VSSDAFGGLLVAEVGEHADGAVGAVGRGVVTVDASSSFVFETLRLDGGRFTYA